MWGAVNATLIRATKLFTINTLFGANHPRSVLPGTGISPGRACRAAPRALPGTKQVLGIRGFVGQGLDEGMIIPLALLLLLAACAARTRTAAQAGDVQGFRMPTHFHANISIVAHLVDRVRVCLSASSPPALAAANACALSAPTHRTRCAPGPTQPRPPMRVQSPSP